jgi:hypothetical protein
MRCGQTGAPICCRPSNICPLLRHHHLSHCPRSPADDGESCAEERLQPHSMARIAASSLYAGCRRVRRVSSIARISHAWPRVRRQYRPWSCLYSQWLSRSRTSRSNIDTLDQDTKQPGTRIDLRATNATYNLHSLVVTLLLPRSTHGRRRGIDMESASATNGKRLAEARRRMTKAGVAKIEVDGSQ